MSQSNAQGSNSASQSEGYLGSESFLLPGHIANAVDYVARQVITNKNFSVPVKVISVTGGGTTGIPMVAVQPMIDMIDGNGNRTPHGVIYNIPAFRYQAGGFAIIVDPAPGDIGHAVVCDRDITQLKVTGKQSAPGSRRKNNLADAIYYGSITNGMATTYIRLTSSGVSITTPQNIVLNGNNITLDASGNLAVKGSITAGSGGSDSVTLQNHKHGTGTAVAGTSVPTPGT